MSPEPVRVGFAGLGSMGGRIVGRLLGAGHPVVGWNRSPGRSEPLEQNGMEVVGTPRELAEQADVVLSMVTDGAAVEEVASGPDGLLAGLGEGTVYADMSTISPDVSRQLARRVAGTGATMLDAPVSGSITTLEAGELAIMVGGDPGAFERIEPVLAAIGPKVTRVGANGQALEMKLAINLALAAGGNPTAFALIVALSASNNMMTASNPVISMITGPASLTATSHGRLRSATPQRWKP